MISVADLRALEPLHAFTEDDLAKLLLLAPPRELAAGELLYEQLDVASSCFLLVRGRLNVERTRVAGTYVVMTIDPGTFVGQIALLDRGRRTAAVRAATPSVGLSIGDKVFDRLRSGWDPLSLAFQDQLAVAGIRQFRGVMTRLAELPPRRSGDAAERARQLGAAGISLAELGQATALDSIQVAVDEAPRARRRV